jgi:hypothetical protein
MKRKEKDRKGEGKENNKKTQGKGRKKEKNNFTNK